MWKNRKDVYDDGANYASLVQDGLKHGKTFKDMDMPELDEIIHVIETLKNRQVFTDWWRGYLSRWD